MTAVSVRSLSHGPQLSRRAMVAIGIIAAAIAVSLLGGRTVPTWLDNHLQSRALDVNNWVIDNRLTHWLFRWILNPVKSVINGLCTAVLWGLRNLRWPGVLALAASVGARTGGWRAAFGGTLALAGVGVVGYWDKTMITLSIMMVSVALALLIGVPLGVWSARSDRVERSLRGLLDTAQVMPVFVYLGLVTLMFSIKNPPVVAAAVIYAVPPAVRITSLGIRQVPIVATEVGQSFGSTRRQLLAKVQFPMAKRTILAGLNQVIMMAFGIVVIGAVLGTGDTGAVVLEGLRKTNIGLAFASGLAIVFAAIALDRVTTGDRGSKHPSRFSPLSLPGRGYWAASLGLVALGTVVGTLTHVTEFPSWLTYDIKPAVTDAVKAVQRNFRNGVPVIGGTESFTNFLVPNVLNPLRDMLQNAPWLVVLGVFAAVGWISKGWRLAVLVAVCFAAIASMGTAPGGASGRIPIWDLAMDTLSQVIVAVVISVLIAVPLGVLAGRKQWAYAVMRPFLDLAQVLPQFVYLVPVLFLFDAGRTPGVIASVVYAVPPGVRLTALGLREVPVTPREAATSFGATPRQELFKVQLPLAMRSVLLGINQTILMVLAMVIISALIGGGALGLLSLGGFQKTQQQFGQGLAGGLSIVLLAIVLDRITQAWGEPADRRG